MSDDPQMLLSDLLADPDGTLRAARTLGPIAQTELGCAVLRHEAVRELLQDTRLGPSFPRFLEQMGVSSGPFYEWMSRTPLNIDGDEHRRWRKLVMGAFTPRSVERLRPFLRAESNRLIDAFITRGSAEFMRDFARQLPCLGLCELIGVPHGDRDLFSDWADTIGLGFNVVLVAQRIADIDSALVQLRTYASQLIAERRREPRDDLVSRLAAAATKSSGFTDQDVDATLTGLVFAGHETTKNQLGWMIVVLSEVPEEWDAVAAQPERSKAVIEELMRFRSAVTSVSRVAHEPVEFLGRRIEAGTQLIASLWSANRDAAAFPAPDRFDVEANRDGVQIAFGQGAHHCLGAALARAELQEALVCLSARLRCPTLEPGTTYLPPVGINGPTELPIRFEAR